MSIHAGPEALAQTLVISSRLCHLGGPAGFGPSADGRYNPRPIVLQSTLSDDGFEVKARDATWRPPGESRGRQPEGR